MANRPFPNISTAFVDENGFLTDPWSRFLIGLWQTGNSSDSLIDPVLGGLISTESDGFGGISGDVLGTSYVFDGGMDTQDSDAVAQMIVSFADPQQDAPEIATWVAMMTGDA